MIARALALSFLLALVPASVGAQPLRPTVETGEVPWPDGALGQVIPCDGVRPSSVGSVRSWHAPVTVHLGEGVDAALVREVLAWSEEALDALEFHHGFPGAQPDHDRGGSASLDVYLTRDGPEREAVVDALDATWIWDRASAFVSVRATSDRAALRRNVTEGIARSIVLGVKADHPPAYVAAMGSSMARLVTGDAIEAAALRAFQAHPERAMFAGAGDDAGRGAGLFFDYVTTRWDDAAHRSLLAMLWGPVRQTPAGQARFWDEPDFFDIARRIFRDEPDKLEGALMDFAAARAVVGTAADDYQIAGVMDDSLAARPIRVLHYDELPRWVQPTQMLEPTGMAAVVVDLRDAPVHVAMSAWFHGSPWQRWMVRVVRVTADGRAARDLGSQVITDGEWSSQLDLLDGYTRVVFVVLNLGDLGYDPDGPQSANGFFSLNVGRGG